MKSIVKDTFRDYDQDDWFNEAVTYRRENVGTSDMKTIFLWKQRFKDSNWFKFQEAVKFNQNLAESILAPLITKLEFPVNLW